MGIEDQTRRVRQAGFCQALMENIADHVGKNHKITVYEGQDFYVMRKNEGITPTEIQSDIRMLRRELLVLSKMYGGA